jgi:hypothetical protein
MYDDVNCLEATKYTLGSNVYSTLQVSLYYDKHLELPCVRVCSAITASGGHLGVW